MIVLAVDTASRSSSVAVLEEDSLLVETTLVNRETHSRHLMDMIHGVMGLAGLRPDRVELFAVTVGPGSFTGLRIGISAVKAMAFARGRPVVGISTLDALAEPFRHRDGLVCPMLDARREEVYSSCYRVQSGSLHKLFEEQARRPASLLADIPGSCLFVGDGARAYRRDIEAALGGKALFGSPEQDGVRAAVVGRMGVHLFQQGRNGNPADLVPCYIRRSDAETHADRGKREKVAGAGPTT
ncbi:MAG: tRNA (adenosine(37)-N6)-threonylcarbamoyltransferase complex dimerization subunit type 1 TsaB [Thermodesulfobacteriota bacterium]